ncbi:M23 family metallopeptidase, partial [Candidatus Halobeggiatoa sp. HSG11]|nr:M23 family metallopeptidase [Candidatus Halobeggiatoa sp. HSG11]
VIVYNQYRNITEFVKKLSIFVFIVGIAGCSTTAVVPANDVGSVPIESELGPLLYTKIQTDQSLGVVSNKTYFKPAKDHIPKYAQTVAVQKRPKSIRKYIPPRYFQVQFKSAVSGKKLVNNLPKFKPRRRVASTYRLRPASTAFKFQRYYQQKGIITIAKNADYGKYGMTRRSRYGYPKKHNGVDVAGNFGDNVYAVAPGIVEVSPTGTNGKLGIYVRIIDSNGYRTDHAHLSRVAVRNGAWVNTGDLVGYMGRTGNVPSHLKTHTHISRWRKWNGKQAFVNPTYLIFGDSNSYAWYYSR